MQELIVDSFAGGGGASLGISWAVGRGPDIAINHDAEAIALHRANHPESTHFCEDVWKVDPVKACAGRPVGLMWLSPDCKHFSKAKGGKPVSKKIRGLAWIAVRWAKAVRPRVIVLENVEEFQTWGPVLEDGKPCQDRKGRTFKAFKTRLQKLGYVVEHDELRACDYGTPKATHGRGRPLPWHTAAECIDWSISCPSIFLTPSEAKAIGVKRPLAANTMRRIANGLKKFVLDNPRPFIVSLTHQGGDRLESIDEPFRTVTGAKRGEKALVVPYLTEHANATNPRSFPADGPLRTQCAQVKGGHFAMVAPTLVQTGYGERDGQAPRSLDIEKPLGTVVGGGVKHALVSAFMAKHYGGHETPGSQMGLPLDTITGRDHNALVASSLVKLRGTSNHGQPIDVPAATISAQGNHLAEVRAFLIKYYGTEQDPRLELPLHTVTSKERFGLVTVEGIDYAIADIGMRMLQPRELYRAQGFPDSYRIEIDFNGKPLNKTAQVRMCGNSVCPPLAEAIVRANYSTQAGEVAA